MRSSPPFCERQLLLVAHEIYDALEFVEVYQNRA